MAASGRGDDGRNTLLAIGEVKWQEQMTVSCLKRLEHVRGLLQAKAEPGAESARLFLFSGAGFSTGLAEQAVWNPSVQLIGLDRLYYGPLSDSSSVDPVRLTRDQWPVRT